MVECLITLFLTTTSRHIKNRIYRPKDIETTALGGISAAIGSGFAKKEDLKDFGKLIKFFPKMIWIISSKPGRKFKKNNRVINIQEWLLYVHSVFSLNPYFRDWSSNISTVISSPLCAGKQCKKLIFL